MFIKNSKNQNNIEELNQHDAR